MNGQNRMQDTHNSLRFMVEQEEGIHIVLLQFI